MNCLCVGGPVDGRRVVIPDGYMHYLVAVCDGAPAQDLTTPMTATKHRYSVFRLHPVTRATLLAHESMTPTAIMEALMDGYHEERRAGEERS